MLSISSLNLLSVIFITFVGGLSLSFIGKKVLQLFNDLLKKIPILRTIYSAIGQMTETFAPKKGSKKRQHCRLHQQQNRLKGRP